MPFNVWCLGCNSHIGKGVRFNAQKKQAGTYLSSKIWSFKMKCHLCSTWMEIQTDPKGSDYVCIENVKRKVETWDANDAESIQLVSEEEAQKLAEDPFYKLEYQNKDVQKAQEVIPQLDKLIDFKEKYIDDFALSQLARKKFRVCYL